MNSASLRAAAFLLMMTLTLLSSQARAAGEDERPADYPSIFLMAAGGVGIAAGLFYLGGNALAAGTGLSSGIDAPLFYYGVVGSTLTSLAIVAGSIGVTAYGVHRYSSSNDDPASASPYTDPDDKVRKQQSRALDKRFPKRDPEAPPPKAEVVDRKKRRKPKSTKKPAGDDLAAQRKAKARRCIETDTTRNADLSDDGLDLLCGAHLNKEGRVVFP